MSSIVAVRTETAIAIAADSRVSQGDFFVPGEKRINPTKIHHVGGGYIGIAGSMAHHNVIRSLAAGKPELFRLGTTDEIFETLRILHPILRDEYFLDTSEPNDPEYLSNQMEGLIISKGGVFSFFSHREVSEYNCYWASGSGTPFALGALHATYSSTGNARELAEAAVAAACAFDAASGLPLESYELTLNA